MTQAGKGARRCADAMVRTLGGRPVLLELPSPPVAGDDGEQLGLRTPMFQSRTICPAAVRSTKSATEVLVAADVLETLLGVSGPGAVEAVVGTAYAVVIDDLRFRLTGFSCVRSLGEACVYHLLLSAEGTEVV